MKETRVRVSADMIVYVLCVEHIHGAFELGQTVCQFVCPDFPGKAVAIFLECNRNMTVESRYVTLEMTGRVTQRTSDWLDILRCG